MEAQDASDQDGNDEQKDSEESAENEEESFSSKVLCPVEKKKAGSKQTEKDLENQVQHRKLLQAGCGNGA